MRGWRLAEFEGAVTGDWQNLKAGGAEFDNSCVEDKIKCNEGSIMFSQVRGRNYG